MTILATEVVTVQRRSGSYVDGQFQVSTTDTFSAEIGLQPAPGRVLQQLPWRARKREVLIGYADERQPALRTNAVPGIAPDRIVRADGSEYEVQGVSDWTPHTAGVPHRTYTLVRVADDE